MSKRSLGDPNRSQGTVQDLSLKAKSWLSLFIIAFATSISFLPYKKTVTEGTEVRNYYEVISYLVQVVATTLLAFIIWLFKRELGIKNFGPISGAEPEVSEKIEPSSDKLGEEILSHLLASPIPAQKFISVPTTKDLLNIFHKKNYMRLSQISTILGTDQATTQDLITQLMLEGKIEKNIVRDRTTFILKDSFENKAIDELVRRISNGDKIEAVFKFVSLGGGVEVDALVETDKNHYIVEIKGDLHGGKRFIETQLPRIERFIIENPTKDGKGYRVVLGIGARPETSPSQIINESLQKIALPVWVVDLPLSL